jgi:hypothetical protein
VFKIIKVHTIVGVVVEISQPDGYANDRNVMMLYKLCGVDHEKFRYRLCTQSISCV